MKKTHPENQAPIKTRAASGRFKKPIATTQTPKPTPPRKPAA